MSHDGRRHHHLSALHDGNKKYILNPDTQLLNVAGQPADNPAKFHPVKETHGLALHPLEDLGAQQVHDNFADFQSQALPPAHHALRNQGNGSIAQHGPRQHINFALRDRARNDARRGPDHRVQLQWSQHHDDDQPPGLGFYRTGVTEQPPDQTPLQGPEVCLFDFLP